MSRNLHDDVARHVKQLLDGSVFVVNHPSKRIDPRECPTGVYIDPDPLHTRVPWTWGPRANHPIRVHTACMDLGLEWTEADRQYDEMLGDTRIQITEEGHMALVEAVGGECPHCRLAMAEGEIHGPGPAPTPAFSWQIAIDEGQVCAPCERVLAGALATPPTLVFRRQYPTGCATCGGTL